MGLVKYLNDSFLRKVCKHTDFLVLLDAYNKTPYNKELKELLVRSMNQIVDPRQAICVYFTFGSFMFNNRNNEAAALSVDDILDFAKKLGIKYQDPVPGQYMDSDSITVLTPKEFGYYVDCLQATTDHLGFFMEITQKAIIVRHMPPVKLKIWEAFIFNPFTEHEFVQSRFCRVYFDTQCINICFSNDPDFKGTYRVIRYAKCDINQSNPCCYTKHEFIDQDYRLKDVTKQDSTHFLFYLTYHVMSNTKYLVYSGTLSFDRICQISQYLFTAKMDTDVQHELLSNAWIKRPTGKGIDTELLVAQEYYKAYYNIVSHGFNFALDDQYDPDATSLYDSLEIDERISRITWHQKSGVKLDIISNLVDACYGSMRSDNLRVGSVYSKEYLDFILCVYKTDKKVVAYLYDKKTCTINHRFTIDFMVKNTHVKFTENDCYMFRLENDNILYLAQKSKSKLALSDLIGAWLYYLLNFESVTTLTVDHILVLSTGVVIIAAYPADEDDDEDEDEYVSMRYFEISRNMLNYVFTDDPYQKCISI